VEEDAQLSQGFYQDDLRAQAHISREAQKNYERELVKHAEAAQNVQQLREEIGNLRTELRSSRTEAESAVATLHSSESSWESQKTDYERELREVQARADDLVKQNNILHQQFESVSSQAQRIRQRTESDISTLEGDISSQEIPSGKEDSVAALREVIKYLRREKEIVDIKYEMLQQENRRLKQQLDRTTADLDETRLSLMSEREKEANSATSSIQHQELLAKINELNLLRESNTTLRSENERNSQRAAGLQSKVSELTSHLAPLEEKVRVLQAEIEAKDDQTRLLAEDNERWKNRNQQILQKYERIDPVELQNLKDQLEAANLEKQKLDTQLQDAIAKNRAVAEAWKNRHDRAVASAKTRLDQNREVIESLEAKINESAKEAANGSSQVENVRVEAETLKQELNQQVTTLQAQLDELRQNASSGPSADAWEVEKKAFEESVKQKDGELARIAALARGAERAKVFTNMKVTNGQRETAARVTELETELNKLKEASAAPGSGQTISDQDFEQRVNDEVQRRLAQTDLVQTTETPERLAEVAQEKEAAVAEAVRSNQEAADAQLSEIIASKEKELSELRAGDGNTDIASRIAEAVEARETELKAAHEQEIKVATEAALKRFKQPTNEKINAAAQKHGEIMFQERWKKFQEEQSAGGGQVSQETINKAVEEATKKKDEEYAEKLQKASDGAKKEAEMRNTLQLGKLQKQVQDAKAKIDSYEKQFGPLPVVSAPGAPQPSQQQPTQAQQQSAPTITPAVQQPSQGANVLQKLQAGRGGGIPRGRGGNQQGAGRVGGPGQGRGQRLSGQHPPPQQGQNQGQRPAVNRPVAAAGSPTTGPGQQRRQSVQQQSQLPRPASSSLNVAAPSFQPGGIKRPRESEDGQGGQGAQTAGQKRTRVANNGEKGNAENAGNDGQA
jgi:nucleoprotein TPR